MSGPLTPDVRHKAKKRMKNSIHLMLSLMTVAIIAIPSPAFAKKIREPTVSDLASSWVGWADSLHYLRIQLSTNGTGLCCLYWNGSPPASYLHRITRWDIRGYNLSLTLDPIDSAAWKILLSGKATPGRLTLQISDGRVLGWRGNVILRREEEIEDAARTAKQRMNEQQE